MNDARDFLRWLYEAAVQSALPWHALVGHLPAPPRGRTLAIGAGKAGGGMAHADRPAAGSSIQTQGDGLPKHRALLANRLPELGEPTSGPAIWIAAPFAPSQRLGIEKSFPAYAP